MLLVYAVGMLGWKGLKRQEGEVACFIKSHVRATDA